MKTIKVLAHLFVITIYAVSLFVSWTCLTNPNVKDLWVITLAGLFGILYSITYDWLCKKGGTI
jgi:hypothetical protein